MLGGGNGVAAGRVHHDHAAARRRLDIDIVDSDARATDDTQLSSPHSKSRAVTFVWLRTTIALKSGMILTSSASGRPVCTDDFERAVARKFIDATLRNGIGDQDFGICQR